MSSNLFFIVPITIALPSVQITARKIGLLLYDTNCTQDPLETYSITITHIAKPLPKSDSDRAHGPLDRC